MIYVSDDGNITDIFSCLFHFKLPHDKKNVVTATLPFYHIFLDLQVYRQKEKFFLRGKCKNQEKKKKQPKEGRNNVMADKVLENNQVSIVGEIVSDFTYSHEVYGEGFYMVEVAVNRLSNYADYIPLMISERLIDVSENCIGERIHVTGQFRSYNRHEELKNRLILSVFVRELEFVDDLWECDEEEIRSNHIELDGYVCKPPVYRKTPLGREIADLLVAVNRSYGKSDYIPCICWGRNARFATTFEVGSHVCVIGRIQSREYVKKISEEEAERRIAYEVSVCKIEELD
jgi:single-stranded DNA-binding protein